MAVHQLGLLGKIVEIEALGLAVFVVCYHQICNRLCFHGRRLGFAELLALGFALRLLGALLLPRTLLLPFRKCGTRASCHRVIVTYY